MLHKYATQRPCSLYLRNPSFGGKFFKMREWHLGTGQPVVRLKTCFGSVFRYELWIDHYCALARSQPIKWCLILPILFIVRSHVVRAISWSWLWRLLRLLVQSAGSAAQLNLLRILVACNASRVTMSWNRPLSRIFMTHLEHPLAVSRILPDSVASGTTTRVIIMLVLRQVLLFGILVGALISQLEYVLWLSELGVGTAEWTAFIHCCVWLYRYTRTCERAEVNVRPSVRPVVSLDDLFIVPVNDGVWDFTDRAIRGMVLVGIQVLLYFGVCSCCHACLHSRWIHFAVHEVAHRDSASQMPRISLMVVFCLDRATSQHSATTTTPGN